MILKLHSCSPKTLIISANGELHRYIKSSKKRWIHYDAGHNPLNSYSTQQQHAILEALKIAGTPNNYNEAMSISI